MKTIASLLASTACAVTLLLGGVVAASAVIVPEKDDTPHFTGLDVTDLWTATPVRVDPTQQSYERLPPRYGSVGVIASAGSTQQAPAHPQMASAVQTIDMTDTGAIAGVDSLEQEAPPLPQAHVSWCQTRYKSYSQEDNSYISYRGDIRTCVSPYLAGSTENGDAKAMLVDVVDNSTSIAMNSAHAQNCLQRYRSYRAEDNSYQPYGGGPRKQCELRSF